MARFVLVATTALLSGAFSAFAAIPAAERDALTAIHAAAGGPSWKNRSGWLGPSDTECSWFGVTCDVARTNVIRLELAENNLSGTISTKIGDLSKLQLLSLWGNDLQGPLPTEIGSLADLGYVNLVRNRLSGPLPPSLASLDKLVHLELDGNQFSGPLPDAIGGLESLEDLEISGNKLTGPLPATLSNLVHLKNLRLASNQIDGPIPPGVGSLASLETIELSFNRLDGTIPPELGRLANLKKLDLWSNRLTGAIPPQLGDLASLQTLFLARNRLTETIPAELFRIVTLEQLVLLGNELSGEIPRGIGSLTRLRVLGLNDNDLTGEIPAEIGALTALQSLELEENDLGGRIPSQLGNLTALETLDLSGNELRGPIPRELDALTKLKTLSLFSNQLDGPIPSELGNLTSLTMLLLSLNRLTGSIPDSMRNLRSLQVWRIHQNDLSGPFPPWLGELTSLTEVTFGSNRLNGTIPADVANLERLRILDFGDNELTGSLPDLSRLTQLVELNAAANNLTGALPAGLDNLTHLEDLRLSGNRLSGPLPPTIGNLTKLRLVDLSVNALEGALPASLGALRNVTDLSLWGNRFSGTIPDTIGDLSALQRLDVSRNALRGPLPASLSRLSALVDRGSDFSYNALYTTDSSLRTFLNGKQEGGDFEATQIVAPSDVRVVDVSDRAATVQWTLIRHTGGDGGYQAIATSTPSEAPAALFTTRSREIDSMRLRGLSPATTYSITVRSVAHPHGFQQNLLVSDPSTPVTATTGPRVVAPADVAVSAWPGGLVQIGGTATGTDSFTVTNFGDVTTSIALLRTGDFFTMSPEAFSLAGGASQTITLTSISRAPGTYEGDVVIRGDGAPPGLSVRVVLLSVTPPAGTVIAQPLASRIELAGSPGSDSVGAAAFRNVGTAPLTGMLLSDQPWVVPARELITIAPQETGSVNFSVVRSKRPAGAEGALSANLSLVYVSGGARALLRQAAGTPPGVSISIVTVVDQSKPAASTGPIPVLGVGEIAYFVPGLESIPGRFRAGISVVNAAGASAISDVRLYLRNSSQTALASLLPLAFQKSVSLVDVHGIYPGFSGAASTMQIRSGRWQALGAAAKATAVGDSGTASGSIPVFRSDRSVASGASLILAGVAQPADLFVQETASAATTVRIEFLDPAGAAVSPPRDETLAALELLTLRDAVPAGAVTLVVTNVATTGGRVAAYARVRDGTSGDTWSVVDWSAFNGYPRTSAVRIPFADGRGSASGRRRAAVHGAPGPRSVTDAFLFNPGSAPLSATLRVIESSGHVIEREVTVEPRATKTIRDAGASAASTIAHLVLVPTRGELAVTARSHHSSAAGELGSAIPVFAASAGLRTGQQQIFTDLDDSTSATVRAAAPATFRTSYGLVETAGGSATVLVRVIVNVSSLVSAVSSRPYQLEAHQQILAPELLRSLVGESRDALGEQHDLSFEVEVIAGSGAVLPFVIVTDNGTGDTSIRTQ